MFLDLGDTLLHIHPPIPELYRRSFADIGLNLSTTEVTCALTSGETLYRDAIRHGEPFESSAAAAREFWARYNEHLLEAVGVDAGAERVRLAAELARRFWSPDAWRPFPEVAAVLGALRRAGLRLAIVSNFTDAILALCAEHGIAEHVDCVIASATVGAQKPDVGIFREALRRMDTDPLATVHVGDNYVADVLGARAAGIDAILVDRTRSGGRGMFDFTIRDGIGGSGGVRLDCPVVGDLTELLTLVEPPGSVRP